MKNKANILFAFLLTLLGIVTLLPLLVTIIFSFIDSNMSVLSMVNYKEVFWNRPDYLMKFWFSLFLSIVIAVANALICSLAGFGLAKFDFKGKNLIVTIVTIMIFIPYQVSLISNYTVLNQFGWIGSYAAIIVPSIFVPFGVFLMRLNFKNIPSEIDDAALCDGLSFMGLFFHIGLPLAKPGLITILILVFIDSWNMVEQPILFLKDYIDYPLSVFLSQADGMDLGILAAACVLALVPVLLIYFFFEDELAQGIELSQFI